MCSNLSVKEKIKEMKEKAGRKDEQERLAGVLKIIKGCNSMELSHIRVLLECDARPCRSLLKFLDILPLFVAIVAVLVSTIGNVELELNAPLIVLICLFVIMAYPFVFVWCDRKTKTLDYVLIVIEEYQKNPAAFNCELVEGGYEYKVIVKPVRGK